MAAVSSVAFPFKGSDNNTYAGQTIPLDASGVVPNSIADGASVTLGARADTVPASPAVAGSVVALLKGIWAALLTRLSVDTVVQSAAISRSGLSTVKAASASVTAGGSGYAAGDTITNAAGVFTVSTVSSGAVTAVTATTPAALTAITTGAQSQTATSGSGTGCTLTPVYAAAAVQVAPANASRRGFAIQNQSTGNLWFSSLATATPDQNSFLVGPGGYFETPVHHSGVGALSLIGASAGQLFYAREF